LRRQFNALANDP